MSTELLVLFYLGVMTFVLVFIQGMQVPLNFGFKWGLGNRDEPREPTAFMGRIARTIDNQIQALTMAVPVLTALILFPEAQSSTTQTGAWLLLFGRLGFAVSYLVGIPYLRSLIWGIGVFGWMMLSYGFIVAML